MLALCFQERRTPRRRASSFLGERVEVVFIGCAVTFFLRVLRQLSETEEGATTRT